MGTDLVKSSAGRNLDLEVLHVEVPVHLVKGSSAQGLRGTCILDAAFACFLQALKVHCVRFAPETPTQV
eukprot:5404270-Amphidinium_carterae.1